MEYIKKKILQATTTGTTTGCTGTCRIIIPNTGATYGINFCLVQDAQDVGFFDAYMLDNPFNYIQLSGATSADTAQNIIKFESVVTGGTTLAASGLGTGYTNGNIIGTDEYWSGGTLIIPTHNYIITGTSEYWSGGTWASSFTNSTYVVTGHSSSRLTELRKYTITNVFAQQYVSGGTYLTDGVDYSNSISGVSIVYFLGGIRYVDSLTGFTSGTTFSFTGQGYSNPNFINKPIYKDMNKENIISNPKIANDVFIVRQEISAFDQNYRLEYINSLIDLETYAGGNFFNIVNNT
jgi:hypothetical protein